MRSRLGKAQDTVVSLQQSVRKAERNLNVSRMDVNSVNSTLVSSVEKIQTLLDNTWSMRKNRAEMLEEIKATRKSGTFRTQVYVWTCFVSPFLWFDSYFSCLLLGATRRGTKKQKRKAGIKSEETGGRTTSWTHKAEAQKSSYCTSRFARHNGSECRSWGSWNRGEVANSL